MEPSVACMEHSKQRKLQGLYRGKQNAACNIQWLATINRSYPPFLTYSSIYSFILQLFYFCTNKLYHDFLHTYTILHNKLHNYCLRHCSSYSSLHMTSWRCLMRITICDERPDPSLNTVIICLICILLWILNQCTGTVALLLLLFLQTFPHLAH